MKFQTIGINVKSINLNFKTKMTSILDGLNEKQRIAASQVDGPILILAGAGSGKTRALTFRVAYLIKEKKIHPKNILAVTFTNKAAGEMLERIKLLLNLPATIPPYSIYLPHVGTFHSICSRILRKEIEKIGYQSSFVIYDDSNQQVLMKKVMNELSISQTEMKPNAILGAISEAKNNLIDAETFAAQVGSYFQEIVAKCYSRYQTRLKESSALDFDDLIMLTVKLFSTYPDILKKYQDIFRYIMVDEYQDTNHAQYFLLKILAEKYRNLCVVGDDWQSIYGWRGANIQNIFNFEKDYPEAKVVLLEQNYRSTQNILDAAHCVITKNVSQKEKKLWTKNDGGEKLTVFQADDEKKEAEFIVDEIKRIKKEQKLKLSDFAVLYRTNAQSRALEEAFLKAAIPYRIVGGLKFYQRKEIKDIISYLLLVHNFADEVSFDRIIGVPNRGLGEKSVKKIIEIAKNEKIDLILAMEKAVEEGLFPPQKSVKLKELVKFFINAKEFAQKNSVSDLIKFIYTQSGYEAMLAKEGIEGEARRENIQELLTVASKYDRVKDLAEGEIGIDGVEENIFLSALSGFLEEISLVSQTDRDLEDKDSVLLMTLHSAKGLEYEVVFIAGLEEGLLPHSRATFNEKELEEERRLCYVGITRAKKKAFLLFTNARNIYGSVQTSIKSRFLDEIDQDLLEERVYRFAEDGEFFEEDTIDFNDEEDGLTKTKKFKDGDRVSHPVFGSGIVISQDENLITVAFPKFGLKKMAKSVAPLEKA